MATKVKKQLVIVHTTLKQAIIGTLVSSKSKMVVLKKASYLVNWQTVNNLVLLAKNKCELTHTLDVDTIEIHGVAEVIYCK